MSAVTSIQTIGRKTLGGITGWGNAWVFLAQASVQSLGLFKRIGLLFKQVYEIGYNSLLVITLIGGFTGAVLAVQGEYTLSKFGATAWTGPMVALALLRELAPVLTALMVIGRAGSAITAEIGIMRITEQIDALHSMAVRPISYLISPRLVATIIAMPLLTAVFSVVGIFGGWLVSSSVLGLSGGTYMQQTISAVEMVDVYSGLIKSTVFGLLCGWVCCYKGFNCGFGAVGVNKATTQAVVTASVAVLITDYFLTSVLTRIFL